MIYREEKAQEKGHAGYKCTGKGCGGEGLSLKEESQVVQSRY